MKKRAFSLVEIIIVMAIIGILSIGVTSFLSYQEKTKTYDAEACMNGINREIKKFTNAALTSKQLSGEVFPDYYHIDFDATEHSITLSYSFIDDPTLQEVQKMYLSGTAAHKAECDNNDVHIQLTGMSNFNGIIMNKGFRQVKPTELFTFILTGGTDIFTGFIQFDVCLDKECISTKELEQRDIDARVQTISTSRCLFYKETDTHQCETRQS